MFLVSYYRSFTTIDFSTATRPVSQFTINKYLQRARFKMRKVVLEKTDQTTMLAFVSGCRYLSELSINSVTMPFNDSIMRAARSTPTLMVLEVGCPTTSSAVAGVIKHAINLQILRCSKIIPSDRFDWDGKNVKASGLKTLSLTWYSMDDYYPAYVHSNFVGAYFPFKGAGC